MEVFGEDVGVIVLVMNRRTRRCFLGGNDPCLGTNYDPRATGLDGELCRLGGGVEIDLLCDFVESF